MLRELKTSVLMLVAMTLVLGVLYPLAVTAIARAFFAEEARGSLIVEDGVVRGSELIGQQFDDPKYFHGRPSATSRVPYDASASSGSNLGPTNPALVEQLKARVTALRATSDSEGPIPVDLVTSSGSGLDPHITPAAARYQIAGVARARGIDAAKLSALVESHVEARALGFLGEARVNVLRLNMALDRLH